MVFFASSCPNFRSSVKASFICAMNFGHFPRSLGGRLLCTPSWTGQPAKFSQQRASSNCGVFSKLWPGLEIYLRWLEENSQIQPPSPPSPHQRPSSSRKARPSAPGAAGPASSRSPPAPLRLEWYIVVRGGFILPQIGCLPLVDFFEGRCTFSGIEKIPPVGLMNPSGGSFGPSAIMAPMGPVWPLSQKPKIGHLGNDASRYLRAF